MKQLFKDKRGSAIITVLIVMGVLTLLGAAVLQYSVNDNLQVHNDERRMQAHYLARSGAEAVANYIMNHSDEVDELVGKETEPVELGKGTFKVKVTEQNPEGLLIESTGYVDDFERTVKLQLVPYESYGLGDFAVFCNSGLSVGNNINITGDVGTNAEGEGSINLGNNIEIDGDVLVGPGGDPDEVVKTGNNVDIKSKGQLTSKVSYAIPDFPDFPTLNSKKQIKLKNNETCRISEDGDYGSIEMKNNNMLVIDVGDYVREVLVDKLTAGTNLEIQLEGKGRLNLYVKSRFEVKSNSAVNNNGRIDALTVYMSDYSSISLDNNGVFNGTIFSNNKNTGICLNNMTINGHIISAGENNVSYDGKNNTTINGIFYAPKSKILTMNNYKINGLIVADTLNIKNNFTLRYPDDPKDLPPLPADIDIGIVSSKGYQKGLWSD
ncbi:MAG: DUF7305 domain-containing protein [Syntrophaceticus sp.]